MCCRDALRVVADIWCRQSLDVLFCTGRAVAERACVAVRVAPAMAESDPDERLTTLFVASTDSESNAGSGFSAAPLPV